MREATAIDYMITALSRKINEQEVVFNGVNSIIPMVAISLAKYMKVPFTYLNIAGGVNTSIKSLPRSTSSSSLLTGSPTIFPNEEFYDLCARGGVDLVYLGSAQIDKYGRSNISTIGPYDKPKVRLPGGGGASVLMPTAKRVVVWRAEHSKRSLPEQLDFVTSEGNVEAVITPLCVFTRPNGELEVSSIYPITTFEEIQEKTGFKVKLSSNYEDFQISEKELQAIDEIDPDGLRFLDWHK
jgi:glutaconate CoA-transferase subunit B